MIRTQRIGLRHVTESDLPWIQQVDADPDARGPFLGSRMQTPHELAKRWRDSGFSNEDAERLLVCRVDDGATIGHVVHFTAARYTTAREIGWTITDPSLRGQGYASEAAQLLVDYLFDNWPLNRLQCGMAVSNHASRRVAEKCGFRHEGVQRGIVFVAGIYQDCHSLGLLRSDWQAMKADRA